MADEFVKVAGLNPNLRRVNMVFKVVSVDPAKNVRSRKDRVAHRVTEALVGDDTGTALMTLWDESVDKVTAGRTLKVLNGYVSLFKGTLRVNIGKYGELEPVDGVEIGVKMDNNVSGKVYDEHGKRNKMYEGFGSGSFWP